MQTYLWIALGGALGSTARYWLSGVVARHVGETFPWETMVVNVTGSFAIGFFAAVTATEGGGAAPVGLRHFFMAGVCGGYTTFSAFSLQTLNLAGEGEWFKAGANAVLSVVLCLVAVWLGHVLGGSINPVKR